MELCAVIKNIRNELDLSQVHFAKIMHVHFSTVNRWENGHAQPNELAVAMMIVICERENVSKELVDSLRTLGK